MNNDVLTKAKKEYLNAGQAVRESLKNIFGDAVSTLDWRSITTPELAFLVNGTTPEEALPYKDPKTPKQIWLNAISTMEEIVRAINPGFFERIDWSDSNQKKWRTWFEFNNPSGGFRFDGSTYDRVNTGSIAGSRLCSEDQEKDKFIATQFIDIWNIILLK